MQLLLALVPPNTTFALLVNPTSPELADAMTRDAETSARHLNLKLQVLPASSEREIEAAFAKMEQLKIGAVWISPDGFLTSQFAKLASLAAGLRLPTIGQNREFVLAGGLPWWSRGESNP